MPVPSSAPRSIRAIVSVVVPCALLACGVGDSPRATGAGASTAGRLASWDRWSESGLALGDLHTCALSNRGTVRCWGSNDSGQLGDGTLTQRETPTPAIEDLVDVVEIVAGARHTCAIVMGGDMTVACWGANAYGQLGDGTRTMRTTPTLIPGLSGVLHLAAGANHTCALLAGGAVKCWGYNKYGQIGDGTAGVDRTSPVDVGGLANVAQVSAGIGHTCALSSDGGVSCWGFDIFGQLGDGGIADQSSPTPVRAVADARQITSAGLHNCAVLGDRTVKCWGWNMMGQIGDRTTTDARIAVDVEGMTDALQVASGGAHTCARLSDRTLKCWGYNEYGQVGDGSTTSWTIPRPVTGFWDVTSVVAGLHHSCALTDDGTTYCWGRNDWGQLGDGTIVGKKKPNRVEL